MVAGNDPQNFARAGNRDAQPASDCLPGRFGGREPSLSGWNFSRPIRGGADFLLQLAHAAQTEDSADFGGDGDVHRWRCLSSGAFRRHHHGGENQLHGARRAESREGRGGTGGGCGIAGRGIASHEDQRCCALFREG